MGRHIAAHRLRQPVHSTHQPLAFFGGEEGDRFAADEYTESFRVRDAAGQPLGYFYLENKPVRQMSMKRLSRGEATRIAANIAKLPELLRNKRTGLSG